MNDSNLNREGRKPVFSRLEAFRLLENRKLLRHEVGLTAAKFLQMMVAEGEIPKNRRVSLPTIQRLLNGTMYPTLRVFNKNGEETETPYDYSDVPIAKPGQPPKEERIDREAGIILPVFTERQKAWQEHVERRAQKLAIDNGAAAARQEVRGLSEQLGIAKQEIESLRAAIGVLSARLDAISPVVS